MCGMSSGVSAAVTEAGVMPDEHLPGRCPLGQCVIHRFVVDCTKSPTAGMNIGYLTLQPHRG